MQINTGKKIMGEEEMAHYIEGIGRMELFDYLQKMRIVRKS